MASAQLAMFAAIFFVLLCGPPALSLWLCILRFRRMMRHGRSGRLYLAGFLFSAAALVINTIIVLMTGYRTIFGPQPFGTLQVAAGALSWLCLWLWIVLLFVRPRIHRRRRL